MCVTALAQVFRPLQFSTAIFEVPVFLDSSCGFRAPRFWQNSDPPWLSCRCGRGLLKGTEDGGETRVALVFGNKESVVIVAVVGGWLLLLLLISACAATADRQRG